MLLWKYKFNFYCQPVDYSSSEHGMAELYSTYFYFSLKILDLCDTVSFFLFYFFIDKNCSIFQLFIILRKKNSQLSFLHCYHHFGILAGSYIAAKWMPGGSGVSLGLINTTVHVIMYFYYFLTSFKPELKKSIWWKKHITQLQLVQFAVLVIHHSVICLSNDCNYPKTFAMIIVIQNTFMLVLFGDFYRKVYIKKKVETKLN